MILANADGPLEGRSGPIHNLDVGALTSQPMPRGQGNMGRRAGACQGRASETTFRGPQTKSRVPRGAVRIPPPPRAPFGAAFLAAPGGRRPGRAGRQVSGQIFVCLFGAGSVGRMANSLSGLLPRDLSNNQASCELKRTLN